MRVTLLAGGTGAAKLALGLQDRLAPGDLTVVANTADDVEVWGLHVSPDTDSVLYRLAGLFNEAAGWGMAGETFAARAVMARLGEPTWFSLGDRDLAVHILRTRLLRSGRRLSEVAAELGRRLDVPSAVYPMSDDPVLTYFDTEQGRYAFQEYFVRLRTEPPITGIEFQGLARARPSPEAAAAIEGADLVVIGPSNPLISLQPILALHGGSLPSGRTVVVSPVVAGRSLKGPTVEMMKALGMDPSASGVARLFVGRAEWFLADVRDAEQASAISELGYQVRLADTVMDSRAAAGRLADAILALGKVAR